MCSNSCSVVRALSTEKELSNEAFQLVKHDFPTAHQLSSGLKERFCLCVHEFVCKRMSHVYVTDGCTEGCQAKRKQSIAFY